jgi:hypothetical protein
VGYNLEKDTCDACGVKREPPPRFEYLRKQPSFRLGHNGEVWCDTCYRERELESLFKLMDKREKESVLTRT